MHAAALSEAFAETPLDLCTEMPTDGMLKETTIPSLQSIPLTLSIIVNRTKGKKIQFTNLAVHDKLPLVYNRLLTCIYSCNSNGIWGETTL